MTLETNTGFVHKVLTTKNGDDVFHIFGEDSIGRRVHLFISVNAINRPKIERALNANQQVDFAQFGNVVASCFGQYPTNDVRQLMKEKYGIDC